MLPNLKKLRNEKGISQKSLAEILGVTQQTVSNYETGEIEPDITLLSRMADYFETSIDDLVGRAKIRGIDEKGKTIQMTDAEMEMILKYRSLNDRKKKCVDVLMETLAEE